VHCLEESIECFLRQDYEGPKELVILNDYGEQELVFDHPEVRIINQPKKHITLGDKFNATVDHTRGDFLCCWEDDDIYLPGAISLAVRKASDGVFHTCDGFKENQPFSIVPSTDIYHATHGLTRELFDKVGGYTARDQCTIDVEFIHKICNELDKVEEGYTQRLPVRQRQYIYRWDTVDSYHGSAYGLYQHVGCKARELVEDRRRRGLIPTGRVLLNPRWKYDYSAHLPDVQAEFVEFDLDLKSKC
jgi:glycosyltransferase involved in cell wall biosynthesis